MKDLKEYAIEIFCEIAKKECPEAQYRILEVSLSSNEGLDTIDIKYEFDNCIQIYKMCKKTLENNLKFSKLKQPYSF